MSLKTRNATTFDERLRLDIAYVNQRSLGLDLKILLLTFAAMLKRAGA